MGGTEAIGVLVGGGIVRYYLVSGGTVGPMDVIREDMNTHLARCDLSLPLDMYFSNLFFDEEDTCFRYLMINTNHVVFQMNGDTTEYELKKRI